MKEWTMGNDALEKAKEEGWTDTEVELVHAPISGVVDYYCIILTASDVQSAVAYRELQGDAEAYEMDLRERMGFEQRPDQARRMYVDYDWIDREVKTYPLFLGGGSIAVCEVGNREDAEHITELWNKARIAPCITARYGPHSPLPWTYHRKEDGAVRWRDWIEDAHGSVILENIGHLDGPLIVERMNGTVAYVERIIELETKLSDLKAGISKLLEVDEKCKTAHKTLSEAQENLRAGEQQNYETKLSEAILAFGEIYILAASRDLNSTGISKIQHIATEGAEQCASIEGGA